MFERFKRRDKKDPLEEIDRMPYVLELRDRIVGKVKREDSGFNWEGRYTPREREEINRLLLALHESTPLTQDPDFESEEALVRGYLAAYFGAEPALRHEAPPAQQSGQAGLPPFIDPPEVIE